MEKRDIGTREILVYENTDSLPELFLSQEENNPAPTEEIGFTFEKVSPVEYKISIDSLNEKTFLYFSQAFHPGWTLYFEEPNYKKGVKGELAQLSSDYHMKYGLAEVNVFELDPDQISSDVPGVYYTTNEDGTLSLDLVLYFKKQHYVIHGLYLMMVILPIYIGASFVIHRRFLIN